MGAYAHPATWQVRVPGVPLPLQRARLVAQFAVLFAATMKSTEDRMTSLGSEPRLESLPPLTHVALRRLFDYWVRLGGQASGLPRLQDFDPLIIPQLLSNIWIVEVEPSSHRFRIRLAGESINEIYGRNIGGKYFADVFEALDANTIVRRYGRCLNEPALFYAKGNVYAAAGRLCFGERLGLPMLGRSGDTDTLIGVTCYGGRVGQDSPLNTTGDLAEYHKIHASNHRCVEIAGP
jgi:hypothetical protein